MLTIDQLGTIELTVAAAVVIGSLAFILAGGATARIVLIVTGAAWGFGIVALYGAGVFDGATGMGTRAVGLAAAAPALGFAGWLAASQPLRVRIAQLPMSSLIALQWTRILGLDFLILQAAGRLAPPFAPIAGWGDVMVGLAALPLAAWLQRSPTARRAPAVFTALGLFDLFTAVFLGVTTAPDSPIRLFHGQGATTMTDLPWLLIPAFLVPLYLVGHLVAIVKLRSMGTEQSAAPRAHVRRDRPLREA